MGTGFRREAAASAERRVRSIQRYVSGPPGPDNLGQRVTPCCLCATMPPLLRHHLNMTDRWRFCWAAEYGNKV